MSSVTPILERATTTLEDATALDGAVDAVRPKVTELFGTGTRGEILRGDWLGHPLHPVLTDVAIGSFTSATILDLIGGDQSGTAARRLIGVGLLAAGPTAWSGWAQWVTLDQRSQRLGLVHAATNGAAIALYASSWFARRKGRQAGRKRALAGATLLGVGGYLGGHLAHADEVG